jgi:N-acetylglutamate synthase-like GNAT family acetyltransferase
MTQLEFGAKPTVLRCARCGRFVDWEEARLQIVCRCRPRVELPPVIVRQALPEDRAATLALFRRDFGHVEVAPFGSRIELEDKPALVAEMKGELAGALAYRLLPDALQILALATEPMWQRSGVGEHLVAEAEVLTRRHGLRRVLFATTNDNLPSLYFYQRRGYRISEVLPGAVVPGLSAPVTQGFGGIPVRDAIRLEKLLD